MELHLICDDILRGLATIPSESVDCVMTSPDYNLGVRYKNMSLVRRREEYLNWCCQWGQELMRVLKPDGSLFLNISGAPSRPLLPFMLPVRYSEFCILQNTFHWIKSISVNHQGEQISVGHFKPLSTPRFVNDMHEYVFHFTKTGKVPIDRKAIGVPYADKSNISRWGHTEGTDVRCRGNTWYVPYKTIQSRVKNRPHPATFPAELALLPFKLTRSGPESTILDPFVGIGNAGKAARWVNAGKFIGIDIEPWYIEESRRRIYE